MNDHRSQSGSEEHSTDDETLAVLAALEGRGLMSADALARIDSGRIDEFEHSAGLVFRALAPRGSVAPVEGFSDRLEAAALLHVTASPDASASQQTAASLLQEGQHAERNVTGSNSARIGSAVGRWVGWAGWAAAAGLLAFVLIGELTGAVENPEGGEASGVEARADGRTRVALDTLLADAETAISPWAVGGIAGDIVWNDEANAGFMRLEGLPVNDPSVSQYQLWIFRGDDPAKEDHPIDGGVFDVRREGQVIVPIDAKLDVGSAGFFAVTVEEPGGVVVSGRDQIVAAGPRV